MWDAAVLKRSVAVKSVAVKSVAVKSVAVNSLARKSVALLLGLTLAAAPALAHKDEQAHAMATGVVKERFDFMERFGEAMSGLMAVVRGEKEYIAGEVMDHLELILEQSKDITSLFPEGSNDSPSEALSNIWTDWAGFEKAAGGLQPRAQNMIEAVRAGGKAALQRNMRNLGTGCRDCHSEYRKKQER